jgi:hypothetical protein
MLADVLKTIPGVTVAWQSTRPGHAHVALFIDSHDALALLARCAEATNAVFQVEPADSFLVSDKEIVYTLRDTRNLLETVIRQKLKQP